MNKQIKISDINFINPESDTVYSDNIIKNLLGAYYFISKDENFYLSPSNANNLQPNQLKTKSLVREVFKNKYAQYGYRDIVSISETVNEIDKYSNQEFLKVVFDLEGWNDILPPEIITLEKKLEDKINNILGQSYFYQISPNTNETLEEDQLFYGYGKYYYDYSLSMSTPILIPKDISQKDIDNSVMSVALAKIEPQYNYFDSDFESVSNNIGDVTQLYNYYSLHYYLLDLFKGKQWTNNGKKYQDVTLKNNFLNVNLLPLLTKYKDFNINYLSSISKNQDLIKKINDYKLKNNQSLSKKKIAVTPDSLIDINNLNILKDVQPFGINISFQPQPKKVLSSLLQKTTSIYDLQKLALNHNENENKEFLSGRTYSAELTYAQQSLVNIEPKEIPIISLNDWIKNITPIDEQIDADSSIIFTNGEFDKDSVFLQKIKKVLLQKKIDQLIKDNRRSFIDIAFNKKSAYNEVILYEIRKFDVSKNQYIQSIILPNTEELDFYKYFDTQIKYNADYSYDVRAWTLIIGNKYKYFDRIENAPQLKVFDDLKNNAGDVEGDPTYFRWLRVIHYLTKLNYSKGQTIFDFIKNNSLNKGLDQFIEIFETNAPVSANGAIFTPIDLENTPAINFSKILFDSYNSDLVNASYKNILSFTEYAVDGDKKLENYNSIANNIIETIINDFSSLFANLIVYSSIPAGDFSSQSFYNPNIKRKTTLAWASSKPPPASGIKSQFIKPLPVILKQEEFTNFSTKIVNPRDFILDILLSFSGLSFFQLDEINTIKKYNVQNIDEAIAELTNYIKQKCVIDTEKFFKGFNFSFIQPSLKDFPNYGLSPEPAFADWYPRFNAEYQTKGFTGRLDFGVINEVDIILAGLPYVNQSSAKVVSSPPPPPDVYPIPFKNVKNKIKFFVNDSFFTYRDYPIKIYEQEKAEYDKLLEIEKQNGRDDGKITFIGDEPSAAFLVHKLETYPETYEDFSTGEKFVIENQGGFTDSIEPNKKYYYVFRSYDRHFMTSNPSEVYEVEIVENSGAIYPIIKIVQMKKDDSRTKTKSFKNQVKINVNPDHILENATNIEETIKSAINLNLNKFGSLTPSIFGRNFKIRITSKRSKKKLDINLSFNKTLDISVIQDLLEQKKKQAQQKTKKTKI
jgi:hypothetical protein